MGQTLHTVTFLDWDGTTLNVQQVESGKSASPPPAPSRAGYAFKGWEPGYTDITADTTCVAQYETQTFPIRQKKRIISVVNRDTTLFRYG